MIFLGAVLLVGCASAPPAAQTVYVPVRTPCVKDLPVAPVYEFNELLPEAPAGEKIVALARDWPRGRKYEGQLLALLLGCL